MKVEGLAAVTGAGQGIGLGVTRALAEHGFDVLALVLEASMGEAVVRATEGATGDIRIEVLDVTAMGDFNFPPDLRIVVNNAGIRRAYLPVEMSGPEEWRTVFDVNFFGLVEVTRRAIPVLRAGGGGVICNISSGSLFSSMPFLGPYRASKAAVSSLCETLRVELAPFAIRVVEVMPGATISGINADSILRRVADAVQFPEYRRMAEIQFGLNQQVPPATPAEDVGRAIVDAIMDDAGPMRYGTDTMSNALLQQWRTTLDEEQMAEVLARYEEIVPR
jgi:NAD(P)-dependent dehydrogenase (short-subunit alcohol dehydrogenase family)